MSKFELTAAQKAAVDARGCPVLVSAAAGSGKTRVLTERLIARVLEGEDVDRFLVITFTRAAAAELRGRILTELNTVIAENPGDRRLRRQSALLYRAQIGTIDSFCTTVVRENTHRLQDISPGFSMLDEERSQGLLARSLEEVLDRAYERVEEDSGLAMLIDSVGAGRDDARLADLVRSLHAQMQSRAFPEDWAKEKLDALAARDVTDAGQTVWGKYLLADAAAEAAYRAEELEKALALMAQPGNEPLMKGYGAAFSDMALLFRDAARAPAEGWDKTRLVLSRELPRLGMVRKFEDEALKARVKAPWDEGKKALANLQKTLAGDSESLLRGIRQSEPALRALMELVFALDKEYKHRKRRADACDFSDVEHLCVDLLCDKKTGGPTALAAELSARFAEVMVDEYQDVNAVQELIFRRVSGEGQRLFMVGDVKQSIYRFRLAEPAIFNEKYAAFAEDEKAKRILLRENFRSRESVLAACNSVFEKIMSPELGEIVYDENARLVKGASYPEAGEVKPELCILDPGAAATEEETPDKTLLEARYVAGRIRAMVDGRELVADGPDRLRPARWGDIAVLLRTPGTSGAAYRRALAEAGVPVSARQGGDFFSQPEVSFVVSMLAAADNPRQDVPLIAAMRALPFGFTPDELTAVRAADRGDFWDALCRRAETNEKCRGFVEAVNEIRDLAREESTQGILRRLYDRTGLMASCSVMADAPQRIANLMQLYEYARKFEQDGNRGLFRFVSWLRELNRRGLEPPTAAAGDAVQIMSIHKSKGLEFPVVFLADCSHQWNRTRGAQVLCHSELGLGMKMTDAARGVTWPTLPFRAIEKKTKIEELSEQERVLYVAMTRARERLIMTCTQTKAEEKLAAMEQEESGPISPRVLAGASSAAPWLTRAAVRDGGSTMEVRLVVPEPVSGEKSREPKALCPAEPEDVEILRQRLEWVYPHETAVTLPSKLTATSVKSSAAGDDPEAAEMVKPERSRSHRFRKPDFGKTEVPLTGAERGIAAHLVMQYIDFEKTGDESAVAGEIARLEHRGFLTEKQAAAVPPGDILAFFRSELGQRLRKADRVVREFRFSLLCPAEQWYAEAPAGEEILLQGVVDCCIEEQGELLILDFKTDAHVEPERYTGQLGAYAMAMERIFRKPVKGAALWYLRKKQLVWVKLPEKSGK